MTEPGLALHDVAVPEQEAERLKLADVDPVLITMKPNEFGEEGAADVEPPSGVTDTETGGATFTETNPVVVSDSPLAASDRPPLPLPLPVEYVTVMFADSPARIVTKPVAEQEATGLTVPQARS